MLEISSQVRRFVLVFIGLVIALGGLVYWNSNRDKGGAFVKPLAGSLPVATPKGIEEEVVLSTSQDGKDLFKRLLWRSAQEEDQILHAERRAWKSPENGLRAWQGYLEIIPSPELLAYLDKNPFRLSAMELKDLGGFEKNAPAWVPALHGRDNFEIEGSKDGALYIIRLAEEKRLLVIGEGYGFKAGA